MPMRKKKAITLKARHTIQLYCMIQFTNKEGTSRSSRFLTLYQLEILKKKGVIVVIGMLLYHEGEV